MFMQYSNNQRTDETATANRNEDPQVSRIRSKVRAHAASINHTGPAPLILIDALRGKGAA